MADLWINKYKPTNIKDILGNNTTILQINDWIKNYFDDSINYNSIVVSGNHGVGKGMIIKLILENNNCKFTWLDYKDDKNKELFDDLRNSSNMKDINNYVKTKQTFVIIIDDIEKITLKSEKKRIIDLVKLNSIRKMFPIIFISNLQHNKLVTDIIAYSKEYKISQPSDYDMRILFNRIIKKENMKINDEKTINKIIRFTQKDIRRLIFVMYDIYNSFKNKELEYEDISNYINNSQKKYKDISLFDSTKILMDEYNGISESLNLYKVDKVLVPLTIHENFYKSLILRYKDNKKILNTLKNVTSSISCGDVIETNIYTDQNWFLHDIHGFYTCVKTSYHINKHSPKYKKSAIPYYDLNFSSDLNQTSLKNINKKQISNIQNVVNDKSFHDIILLNNIVYNLMNENEISKLHDIVGDYDKTMKTIETFIKIDKTIPKITISQKNKKIFNHLVKNS